ncbi:MAG: phosphatase PAP2 family protein [Dehalococcoidia bacterium]|nr:phosphatase PAP2 family protein [Dehalococcoidia bacterium]
MNVDERVVLWLNQWAGRWSVVDSAAEVLVSDYFVPVAAALCLVALWFTGDADRRDSHQRAVIRALATVGFASWVVLILNDHYFRPRPFVEHDLTMLFYPPTDSSFPAHPAAVGFALAAGTWGGNRKAGVVVYVLAALWGASRVFAGVFYPSDILVGAAIGVVVSHAVAVGLRLIEPVPTLVLRGARRLHLA